MAGGRFVAFPCQPLTALSFHLPALPRFLELQLALAEILHGLAAGGQGLVDADAFRIGLACGRQRDRLAVLPVTVEAFHDRGIHRLLTPLDPGARQLFLDQARLDLRVRSPHGRCDEPQVACLHAREAIVGPGRGLAVEEQAPLRQRLRQTAGDPAEIRPAHRHPVVTEPEIGHIPAMAPEIPVAVAGITVVVHPVAEVDDLDEDIALDADRAPFLDPRAEILPDDDCFGWQRGPADHLVGLAPGNPRGCPDFAGHPDPAGFLQLGPAPVVVNDPAEGFLGDPGPALVGPRPTAHGVRPPERILPGDIGLPDEPVGGGIHPDPVRIQGFVEQAVVGGGLDFPHGQLGARRRHGGDSDHRRDDRGRLPGGLVAGQLRLMLGLLAEEVGFFLSQACHLAGHFGFHAGARLVVGALTLGLQLAFQFLLARDIGHRRLRQCGGYLGDRGCGRDKRFRCLPAARLEGGERGHEEDRMGDAHGGLDSRLPSLIQRRHQKTGVSDTDGCPGAGAAGNQKLWLVSIVLDTRAPDSPNRPRNGRRAHCTDGSRPPASGGRRPCVTRRGGCQAGPRPRPPKGRRGTALPAESCLPPPSIAGTDGICPSRRNEATAGRPT